MTYDPFFGLPSPLALAIQSSGQGAAKKLSQSSYEFGRRIKAGRIGAALAAMLATLLMASSHPAHAEQTDKGLEGAWSMVASESVFDEAVTGPAPRAAQWVVSRDDASGFSYRLTERDGQSVISSGDYAVSWATGRSQSTVDGRRAGLSAQRFADDRRELVGAPVGVWRAAIRIKRVGPNRVVIDHVIVGPTEERVVEHLTFVRDKPLVAALQPSTAQSGF